MQLRGKERSHTCVDERVVLIAVAKVMVWGRGICTRGTGGIMKDEIVDEHEIKEKPIGAAEADFETVLVDGILGFGLSIGNAVLVLIMALVHASSAIESNIVAMCVAVLTCLLLFIGLKLTDAFQRAVGRKIILVSYMVSFLGAAACLILRFPYLSVALASLGTVAASFLYGRALGCLIMADSFALLVER